MCVCVCVCVCVSVNQSKRQKCYPTKKITTIIFWHRKKKSDQIVKMMAMIMKNCKKIDANNRTEREKKIKQTKQNLVSIIKQAVKKIDQYRKFHH